MHISDLHAQLTQRRTTLDAERRLAWHNAEFNQGDWEHADLLRGKVEALDEVLALLPVETEAVPTIYTWYATAGFDGEIRAVSVRAGSIAEARALALVQRAVELERPAHTYDKNGYESLRYSVESYEPALEIPATATVVIAYAEPWTRYENVIDKAV